MLLSAFTLVFVALSTSALFVQLLELPLKVGLTCDHGAYVSALYHYFGPTGIVFEIGSIASLIGLVVFAWRRPLGRGALLAAMAFITTVVAWATALAPVHAAVAGWDGLFAHGWAVVSASWAYIAVAGTVTAVLAVSAASLGWVRRGIGDPVVP
jgi:hypothetical protein